ncbi:Hypothetical_protein [Hexamita inflata]|uniref:Hypothetical_protein n=1 Tax=Hexamita inflata TaxID=28002 RepID=A0ABP1L0Y1_9EUKA
MPTQQRPSRTLTELLADQFHLIRQLTFQKLVLASQFLFARPIGPLFIYLFRQIYIIINPVITPIWIILFLISNEGYVIPSTSNLQVYYYLFNSDRLYILLLLTLKSIIDFKPLIILISTIQFPKLQSRLSKTVSRQRLQITTMNAQKLQVLRNAEQTNIFAGVNEEAVYFYSGGPSKCFFELGRRMKFII